MNSTFEPRTSVAGIRSHIRASAGAVVTRFAALLFSVTLCAGIVGCSFLKPARSTARYFVLTPLPAPAPAPAAASSLAVGLGQVKLPAYLFNSSLVVRKGTNEVEYLPSVLWAERLDTGFQRVLAADLAIVLPTDRIHQSAWQRDAVAAAGQRDAEQLGGALGVVEEHLVEVAHAKEQDRVLVPRLDFAVLQHER